MDWIKHDSKKGMGVEMTADRREQKKKTCCTDHIYLKIHIYIYLKIKSRVANVKNSQQNQNKIPIYLHLLTYKYLIQSEKTQLTLKKLRLLVRWKGEDTHIRQLLPALPGVEQNVIQFSRGYLVELVLCYMNRPENKVEKTVHNVTNFRQNR